MISNPIHIQFFRNIILLFFTCFLFYSCYNQDRILPRASIVTNSTTTSSLANTSTTGLARNSISGINFKFSELVDTNGNNYMSSFKITINTVFKKNGLAKYRLYFSENSSSKVPLYLLDSNSIELNNPTRSFSITKSYQSDDLLPVLNSQQTTLKFYIHWVDSTGKSMLQPLIKDTINFLGSMTLEKVSKDTLYYARLLSYEPVNFINANSNYFNKSFDSLKIQLTSDGRIKPQKLKIKLFYCLYSNSATISQSELYSVSQTLTLTGMNTIKTKVTPLTTISSKANYLFFVEIYGENDVLIQQSNRNTFTALMESPDDDNRRVKLDYFSFEPSIDSDKDGFPYAYRLKLLLNTSDNVKQLESFQMEISPYGINTFSNLKSLTFYTGDTAKIDITSGANYRTHSYYDLSLKCFETNQIDGYPSGFHVSFDPFNTPKFRAVPFELASED